MIFVKKKPAFVVVRCFLFEGCGNQPILDEKNDDTDSWSEVRRENLNATGNWIRHSSNPNLGTQEASPFPLDSWTVALSGCQAVGVAQT